jgi:hypothetical protein
MPDTAESTRPAAPNPVEPTARHGHESLIAQPSTFLLPRGHSRAMAEESLTPVDKDQLQGLVSGPKRPYRTLQSCEVIRSVWGNRTLQWALRG